MSFNKLFFFVPDDFASHNQQNRLSRQKNTSRFVTYISGMCSRQTRCIGLATRNVQIEFMCKRPLRCTKMPTHPLRNMTQNVTLK